MKKKHFHKWLAKLFEIIQEQKDKGSTSLLFLLGYQLNITSIRQRTLSFHLWVLSVLSEVVRRIREEGIESFADDFFIWEQFGT